MDVIPPNQQLWWRHGGGDARRGGGGGALRRRPCGVVPVVVHYDEGGDGARWRIVVMIYSLNFEVFELDTGFYCVCRSGR